MHAFPGLLGIVLGAMNPLALWFICYYTKKHEFYNLDPKGVPGSFEPFLAKYLKIAELLIGLATGSIVLLVGSSTLHGQSGHLPALYASPLFLLAFAVLYGILFSAWLIFHYEDYQHNGRHSKAEYALCEVLGFSMLLSFVSGYVCLIMRVTA